MARSHPLRALYISRLREFYRQPARIFWVYGFPTLLAVILGLAFQSQPVETIPVDLVSGGRSMDIAQAFEKAAPLALKNKRPVIVIAQNSREDALKRLRTGKTPLVIEPTSSAQAVDLNVSHAPLALNLIPITYHYDPTRPDAVTARAAVDDLLQKSAGRVDPVATTDVKVSEPGSRYIDFLIPGLIGVNTMGGGLWGIGFLLVNFRIAKLLKCFVATPMPRRDFLLAILGARMTFLIPDLTVLLLLGRLAFGMPIRGSFALIVLVDVVGALAFAGIGLLVASRAQSTETVSGLMNLVMLPMWLFSGVFFSAERFPHVVQPFIQALPLTQLIAALRAVILDGAGLVAVAPAIAIMSVWGIVTFLLALRIFRWT